MSHHAVCAAQFTTITWVAIYVYMYSTQFGGLEWFVAREVGNVNGRMWRWPSDASEMRSAHKSLGDGKVRKCYCMHVWHCFEDIETPSTDTPLALAASLQHFHRCL